MIEPTGPQFPPLPERAVSLDDGSTPSICPATRQVMIRRWITRAAVTGLITAAVLIGIGVTSAWMGVRSIERNVRYSSVAGAVVAQLDVTQDDPWLTSDALNAAYRDRVLDDATIAMMMEHPDVKLVQRLDDRLQFSPDQLRESLTCQVDPDGVILITARMPSRISAQLLASAAVDAFRDVHRQMTDEQRDLYRHYAAQWREHGRPDDSTRAAYAAHLQNVIMVRPVMAATYPKDLDQSGALRVGMMSIGVSGAAAVIGILILQISGALAIFTWVTRPIRPKRTITLTTPSICLPDGLALA